MKKFKCPFCDETTTELEGMHEHIEDEHDSNLPSGVSINEFYYSYRTGKTHGNCVECRQETKWNPNTNKFNRFCGRPECKEAYVDKVRQRMIGKYGTTTLLNDPEHQKKMLKNRSISGTYRWSDGKHETDYTGSYELDFLKFLDVFLEFDPADVIMPSPHTYYYEYEKKKHFYIPDAFIPSLNLEIEIKDGGTNPNMHHKIQAVDKVKESLKDEVMTSQKERSYVKVLDKDYSTFAQFLLMKKEEFAANGETEKPIFILDKTKTYSFEEVKENAILESTTSFSAHEDKQVSRIGLYIDKVYEYQQKCDLTEFGGETPLNFTSFKYMMNLTDREYDESQLVVGYNSIYEPYGIYIDDIAYAFSIFMGEVADGAKEYAEKSFNDLIRLLETISDNTQTENQSNIIRRDYYAMLLQMQTIMNYGMSKIYNADIFYKFYEFLTCNLNEENELDVDVTLESAILESVSNDVKGNFNVGYERWLKNGGVLIVTGNPGSGKSTLAKKIAKENGSTFIELDMFSYDYNGHTGSLSIKKDMVRNNKEIHNLVNKKEKTTLDINNLTTLILEELSGGLYGHSFVVDTHFTFESNVTKYIKSNKIPIIIMSTSDVIASFRASNRDYKDAGVDKIVKGFVQGYQYNKSVSSKFDQMKNVLTEATTYVFPVYVLLTHTGTVLSNAIKSVTKNPYSHSSISFTPELNDMYSFGRKYKSNPLIGTFVKENIREGLFEDVSDTAVYSLYVTFVNADSYARMKKKLKEFQDSGKRFKYNFTGLVMHQMGIASNRDDAYFCSQFVDTILKENDEEFFNRDSSLVKPYDFAKHDSFLHVSRGKLKNYDVNKVKEKVSSLEREYMNQAD